LIGKAEQAPAPAPLYDDRSTRRLVLFAGTLIVIAVAAIGFLVYAIAERAVLDKLQQRDLPLLLDFVHEKVDARISKAEEISLYMADDPANLEWVEGGERDERLGGYAADKLQMLAERHGYTNSFIVSAVTHHYWTEKGQIIDTLSEADPDDSWFFDTIRQGEKLSTQVDYNEQRQGTFVFVNALMGDAGDPIGVAGVGFGLEDLSDYLRSSKYGGTGSIWLVSGSGEIVLSDDPAEHGLQLEDAVPDAIAAGIRAMRDGDTLSLAYEGGKRGSSATDLIGRPLRHAGMKLVVLMPRSFSVSILDSMKWNVVFAVVVSVLSFVLLFAFVSRRLANPYRRALELNRHLETLVSERTQQLQERNAAIMDSIDYAKRIQESLLLPAEAALQRAMREHFALWKPRDTVGGDFYWCKALPGGGTIVAVGDCTGHGVPGAMMTMLAVSLLERIVDQDKLADSADIVSRLHRLMQAMLHQEAGDRGSESGRGRGASDDGLDIGVCVVKDGRLQYTGAGVSLYRSAGGDAVTFAGDRRSVGYRRTPADYPFSQHGLELADGMTYYLTTDGFIDQNGGERGFSFGKSKLLALIGQQAGRPLEEQRAVFAAEFDTYRGEEPQRDDVTLVAFRP